MSDSGCMSAAGRARFDKHRAVTISGFLFCQIIFFILFIFFNARFLTLTQNEGEMHQQQKVSLFLQSAF